jgi:hypothetical protein
MLNSNQGRQSPKAAKISNYLFGILTAIFLLLLITNRDSYFSILREDNLIEWLTFVLLTSAGIISLIIGLNIKSRHGYLHWFFLVFFAFNILAGLEEISWGQRVFDMKTEGVFAKYSDQNEINFHNTLQGLFMVKTKHIAMYALFLYGIILPWLIKAGKINTNWINSVQLIVPPGFLTTGFLLATFFMIDIPTGQEEEIGEFFYSFCFLLMMVHNLNLLKTSDYFALSVPETSEKKIPSFNE